MNSVQDLYEREVRRLRAFELAQAGWKQKDIASELGVTKGAISQWMNRARQGGRTVLYRHPAPGAVSLWGSDNGSERSLGLTRRTDSRDEVLPELGVRQFFDRQDASIIDFQVELEFAVQSPDAVAPG